MGAAVPLFLGERGFHLTVSPGSKPTSIPSGILIHQPFGHNRHGPKNGGVPFWGRAAGSPSNTVCPGSSRPTSMPSFVLMHPTVWPQYTNVADRTDRQRSDRIGRTVLQTVVQSMVGYLIVNLPNADVYFTLIAADCRELVVSQRIMQSSIACTPTLRCSMQHIIAPISCFKPGFPTRGISGFSGWLADSNW